MTDIALHETGSGGDAQLVGNDIDTTGGIFNQIYMALFGGNPNASTTGEELATEQKFDWWGNNLIAQDKPTVQQNSTLERVLSEVALNSSGRFKIIEAVKTDLAFLKEVAEISVDAIILDTDKVEIRILAQEPENIQEQQFIFIWDATKEEIIEFSVI